MQPEYRPYAAIDGNPDTAWEVAHGVEPLAPVIALTTETPISSLRITQPVNTPNRVISRISISLDNGDWTSYELNETSLSSGQELVFNQEASIIAIRIDAVRTTRTLQPNEKLSGVGFSEIVTGLAPTQEVGVLPSRGLENLSPNSTLTYVMTRRLAPLFRDDRRDIETNWARSFYVPQTRTFSARVRIDATSLTPAQIEDLRTQIEKASNITIDSKALNLQTRYDQEQKAIIGEAQPFALGTGSHVVTSTSLSPLVDQVILESKGQIVQPTSLVVTDIQGSTTHKTATLAPCPSGCWLVFGEGHNPGWRATIDETNLGEASIVDGGSHGWWLPPTDKNQQLTLTFTPQRTLNIALLLSALTVAIALALAFFTRHKNQAARHSATFAVNQNIRPVPLLFVHTVSFFTFAALVDMEIALLATLCIVGITVIRRSQIALIVVASVFVTAMMSSWWEIIASDPPLNFDWTHTTDEAHTTIVMTLAILAVLSLVLSSSDELHDTEMLD